MERFAACFAELGDPPEDNARHALNEILVIAFCAILCGTEDCSDIWHCLVAPRESNEITAVPKTAGDALFSKTPSSPRMH
jgi:hypothetical protein